MPLHARDCRAPNCEGWPDCIGHGPVTPPARSAIQRDQAERRRAERDAL